MYQLANFSRYAGSYPESVFPLPPPNSSSLQLWAEKYENSRTPRSRVLFLYFLPYLESREVFRADILEESWKLLLRSSSLLLCTYGPRHGNNILLRYTYREISFPPPQVRLNSQSPENREKEGNKTHVFSLPCLEPKFYSMFVLLLWFYSVFYMHFPQFFYFCLFYSLLSMKVEDYYG